MPASANWMRATAAWLRRSNRGLPAARTRLILQGGCQGAEVQGRELYVKFGEPGGITESARSDPRFNRLGHLEVQPVEPLQAITVDAGASDRLHGLEDVGDGLRDHPDGGEERRVVGEHAAYCSSVVCSWSIASGGRSSTGVRALVAASTRTLRCGNP